MSEPKYGFSEGGAQAAARRLTECRREELPRAEVRGGGREETPHVRDQGQPGEAILCPRPGAVTLRSHPEPEARGGSWEEPPTPEAGLQEQPQEWWLCRHRRA